MLGELGKETLGPGASTQFIPKMLPKFLGLLTEEFKNKWHTTWWTSDTNIEVY